MSEHKAQEESLLDANLFPCHTSAMAKHPLKRWRESHDETMTLDFLAAALGVGKSLLSEIEHGKKSPSLELACRLEEITGLHPREFLRPRPDPAP